MVYEFRSAKYEECTMAIAWCRPAVFSAGSRYYPRSVNNASKIKKEYIR